jgi:preprotein translocase subunit SecF
VSVLRRLYRGETTADFIGRRWWGFGLSILLVVVSAGSLVTRGLNLGIDFEGGVSWELVTEDAAIADVEGVLEDNGIDPTSAKIQELRGADGRRLRIQASDQTQDVITSVRGELASLAGIDEQDVSVSSVSSTWGRSITEKAVRALLVFFVLVSLFIAWRFEWKMALAAFAAMVHDVVISVGVYSVTGFSVTPATVVAFLTILGYSLYDTIVVFDKVHENAKRFGASRVSYGDVVNVSMNQVLMRSLNTTISSVLPVLALLVVGSFIMGVVSLQEFALALLVGLTLGAYSSIYIAAPMLAVLKEREARYAPMRGQLHLGAEMAALAGLTQNERSVPRRGGTTTDPVRPAPTGLTHPPRPRKKKRR